MKRLRTSGSSPIMKRAVQKRQRKIGHMSNPSGPATENVEMKEEDQVMEMNDVK